jgi:hypothetical protein
MGQLSLKLRSIQGGVAFWCPGCEEMHQVRTGGSAPWQFDGNVDRPTFSPSVLVTSGHFVAGNPHPDTCWCTYNREHPDDPAPFKCARCHTFVRNGRIEFLGDCTHALAGQTVDLPDLPAHVID